MSQPDGGCLATAADETQMALYETLTRDSNKRFQSQSPRQEEAAGQLSHAALQRADSEPSQKATSAGRIPRAERNHPNGMQESASTNGPAFPRHVPCRLSAGACDAADVTPGDQTERRRQQREYRTCLDEQVAEKHRRQHEESLSSSKAASYSYRDAASQGKDRSSVYFNQRGKTLLNGIVKRVIIVFRMALQM